jgi:hypothetical protein
VERIRKHAVLMVVARQGTGVRRHRACPVLGRTRRGRADHAGTLAQVRWNIVKEKRLAYLFDFGISSRIRTCAHGSGVQSHIQPLPAETQPSRLAWGAYGARGIVAPSIAICRHGLP